MIYLLEDNLGHQRTQSELLMVYLTITNIIQSNNNGFSILPKTYWSTLLSIIITSTNVKYDCN